MHFTLLIFVFLLCAVLWGFFHSNPQGVDRLRLHSCNAVVIALGVALAIVLGSMLYADAVATKSEVKGLALYLSVMAGGTAFLITVSAGGLVRNLVFFPLSRRRVQQPQ